MQTARASCLCGDIRCHLDLPSQWVAHCHCSLCRRAHGAAFVTWVGMAASDVTIDDPQSRLRWYGSSPGAQRGFCARCGSSLLFRSKQWPGELHVAMGCLDEPVDRMPQAHAYWDTHVDWATPDPHDCLPRKPDPGQG